VMAQSLGIEEGGYRVLPVRIEPIDVSQLPLRLSMLATVDLADSPRAGRELDRLASALRGPLPRRQAGYRAPDQ
jgi:hypothetical protein